MSRPQLPPEKVSAAAVAVVAGLHRDVVDEVAAAVARDRVVVVGMAQNPFVKQARRALSAKGIACTYLEFGSYFSAWQPRLAIKLWAGFPTFPMVFVEGTLIGGASELDALLASGKLA